MNSLTDFFAVIGLLFCYWSCILLISGLKVYLDKCPLDWPVWVYRQRKKWQLRKVDLDGLAVVVMIIGLLWIGLIVTSA